MNTLSSDNEGVLLSGERQRLMVAHLAASKFFRRELLRANTGWALEQLKERGAEDVLSTESTWKIGYAPDSYSRLVDHLRARGFDFRTLIRAGLADWSEDGRAIDQFRDQLMLLTRDERLDPVGFVGIGPSAQPAFETTPTTLIHSPSSALAGIAEQIDLLTEGAMAVVVNDPLDAMAIEKASRLSIDRWAGIPLCGATVSTAQARTLYRYTATDTVIVALNGDETWQKKAVASLPDLSVFFRRVHAVLLPDGHTPATLIRTEEGPRRLHDALLSTGPLADYKPSTQLASGQPDDLRPSSPGPGL